MIGIFDSGIGGVTVLKEIVKILPDYEYIYYSDSINNPYGEKSYEELCEITSNIVEYLTQKGCKIIVIACNTASAICKEYLRNKYDIPILAIEPAYKGVGNGKTLIMATIKTIESVNFLKLYEKYDNHNTILLGCSGLADLIEQNKTNEIKKYLKENLGDLKNIENVVLGCTHYSLIKQEIKEILGSVKFYDGSIGLAKRLQTMIKGIRLNNTKQKITFIDSKHEKEKEIRFWRLLK